LDPQGLVRAYYDAINRGAFNDLDAVLDPQFVEHEEVRGVPPTRDGIKIKYRGLRAAFPDFRFAIDDLIAGGDRVAVRLTVSGTNTEPFMERAPTGRTFAVPSVGFFRIAGGRIVEHWGVFDQFAMLVALGGLGE